MATKTFIRFYFPGVIVSPTYDREVTNRDFTKIIFPKYAYGFHFYDQEIAFINGERLEGKEKNESHFYVIGEKMTIVQVEKEYPTIAYEMRTNDIDEVIKCPHRWYIPHGEVTIINPNEITFESEE